MQAVHKKDTETQNAVKVVIRCRPLSRDEKNAKEKPVVQCDYNTKEVSIQDKQASSYYFDKVFNSSASQEFVYRSVVADVVEDALKGFSCTVFAYGQTGTGKTYTMEGKRSEKKEKNSPFWYGEHAGMIPRAAQHIFQRLEACSTNFSVSVSCLEIFNEEVIDLMVKDDEEVVPLFIHDGNHGKGVTVSGLREVRVNSPDDIFKILKLSSSKRHTDATNCNDRSSRSHCIFTITIHSKEDADNGEDLIRTGKLHLVDLAGSENTKRSGVKGASMKQAVMINKSLLTLRRVITGLSSSKKTHIPFRDSKLTRLLQESLGGKAKTCMIATIAPTADLLEESRSTLQYALSARNIKTTPVVHQKLTKKAKIREFEVEIESLRNQLAASCSADGFYVDKDTWQDYLVNVDLFKDLTTNIENKDLHISQLDDQSKERAADLIILEKQCEENAIEVEDTQKDLTIAQKEMEESKERIAAEVAKLDDYKRAKENLQNQMKQLQEQAIESSADLARLHNSIIFHHERLSLGREYAMESQATLCSEILKILQRLQTFQMSHNQHESKIGDCWRQLLSIYHPMMETIKQEKLLLQEFVEKQLTLLQETVEEQKESQFTSADCFFTSRASFASECQQKQQILFENLLERMDILQDQFEENRSILSNWKEGQLATSSQSFQMEQKRVSKQQKLHRQHHALLDQFISKKDAIATQHQSDLTELCTSVENAVTNTHADILQEMEFLLAENAKNQNETLHNVIHDISQALVISTPPLRSYQLDQGSLMVDILDNLATQKQVQQTNTERLHQHLHTATESMITSHESVTQRIGRVKDITNSCVEETSPSWDSYAEQSKILEESTKQNFTKVYDDIQSHVTESMESMNKMFSSDFQKPIESWRSLVEGHPFLKQLNIAYSGNDKTLEQQSESLEEINATLQCFIDRLQNYIPGGGTPTRNKNYPYPEVKSIVTPPPAQKRSSKPSRAPIVTTKPTRPTPVSKPSRPSVVAKPTTKKRTIAAKGKPTPKQRRKKATISQNSRVRDEPPRKRRKLGEISNVTNK